MEYDYSEYGFCYVFHKHKVVFICSRIITEGYLSAGSIQYEQDTLGE